MSTAIILSCWPGRLGLHSGTGRNIATSALPDFRHGYDAESLEFRGAAGNRRSGPRVLAPWEGDTHRFQPGP